MTGRPEPGPGGSLAGGRGVVAARPSVVWPTSICAASHCRRVRGGHRDAGSWCRPGMPGGRAGGPRARDGGGAPRWTMPASSWPNTAVMLMQARSGVPSWAHHGRDLSGRRSPPTRILPDSACGAARSRPGRIRAGHRPGEIVPSGADTGVRGDHMRVQLQMRTTDTRTAGGAHPHGGRSRCCVESRHIMMTEPSPFQPTNRSSALISAARQTDGRRPARWKRLNQSASPSARQFAQMEPPVGRVTASGREQSHHIDNGLHRGCASARESPYQDGCSGIGRHGDLLHQPSSRPHWDPKVGLEAINGQRRPWFRRAPSPS